MARPWREANAMQKFDEYKKQMKEANTHAVNRLRAVYVIHYAICCSLNNVPRDNLQNILFSIIRQDLCNVIYWDRIGHAV